MTYKEFRRQLGKAGLSVKDFAVLIKQNPNSISNYAVIGEVPSHLAVIAALVAELADHQIDFRAVLDRIEFSQSKTRGGKDKKTFGAKNASASKVAENLQGQH